jgi:hypothetical protein
MLMASSPALADWWVAYDITGELRTLTPLAVQKDALSNQGETPVWSDGATTEGGGGTAPNAILNSVSVTPGSVTYPLPEDEYDAVIAAVKGKQNLSLDAE